MPSKADQNAQDIRALAEASTALAREIGVNNEKTAQAIQKADDALDELAEHIRECNEVNRRLERTLYGVGGLLTGLGILDNWEVIAGLFG